MSSDTSVLQSRGEEKPKPNAPTVLHLVSRLDGGGGSRLAIDLSENLSYDGDQLVGGTFKDPSFRPDMKRVGLRAAIALTLGNIAPPAALLATIETGPGKDAQCGGRYAK